MYTTGRFIGKNIRMVRLTGWICLFIVIFFTRCAATLEKPPQQKAIHLITPVNHQVTVNTNQTFSWGSVQTATYYQFQLAFPDFSADSNMLTDSALKGTVYETTLARGKYEWCVQAISPSSVTVYSDTNTFPCTDRFSLKFYLEIKNPIQ